MTLGKRALLLIFPVVLASYAVAALTVYVLQRESLLRVESALLNQQMAQLDILYRSDKTLARSLLGTLVGMPQFQAFLKEGDDSFRSNAMTARLEQTVRSLASETSAFMSLSVLSPTLNVAYYNENSGAPFAEIDPVAVSHAKAMFDGVVRPEDDLYIAGERGPLILVGEIVDPDTMSAPVGKRRAEALAVQVAIRPERFLAVWRLIETSYRAPIEVSSTPLPPAGELSASVRIGATTYVRLVAPPDYLADRTGNLLLLLFAGALVMSFLSISLLILLIRRFITRPVAELDQQVTEIVAGSRQTIDLWDSSSAEIHRLAGNVKRLHENVIETLERVREASNTDTLTGISNRAHFSALAAEMLADAAANGAELSLLFMDVDHFKLVNDRFGHEAGDAVLKHLARSIDEVVRRHVGEADALVARLSGDEFAALLPLAGHRAAAIAEAIVSLFHDGFAVGSERYPIGISIGIATYPGDADSVEDLIARADVAMYAAKAQGRNGHARYTPDLQPMRRRGDLVPRRASAPDISLSG